MQLDSLPAARSREYPLPADMLHLNQSRLKLERTTPATSAQAPTKASSSLTVSRAILLGYLALTVKHRYLSIEAFMAILRALLPT